MPCSNTSAAREHAALTRLREALDEASSLPLWTIDVAVVVGILSFIVMLHLLALLLIGPCAWAAYRRRCALAERQLLPQEEPAPAPAGDEDAAAAQAVTLR